MSYLKKQAVSGVKWTTIHFAGRFVITFFLSIILARILTPKEFGITAMVSIFIAIASVFINSGLSSAIVRDPKASSEEFTSVFYFNFVVSLVFYISLFFLAHPIANFFNEPVLVSVTRWISLVFVFNGFGIVQNALLVRDLNFKYQTIYNLIGLFVSAVISSIMAWKGFGVHSIVAQAVSQAFVTNGLLWVTSSWRPSRNFSFSVFKRLWKFSSKILTTSIFIQIIDQIDNLFIGKLFHATALGLYGRGKSTTQMVFSFFNGIVGSVSFALLSKVNTDTNEFSRVHTKLFSLSLFVCLPLAIGLVFSSEPLIIALYGSKWLFSVPFLQLLAITIIPDLLGTLFAQSFIAIGNSTAYMKVNIIKKSSTLLSLFVGLIYGIYAFTIAFVALKCLGALIDFIWAKKSLHTSAKIYWSASILNILPTVIMTLILVLFMLYLKTDIAILNLFLIFIFGTVSYILSSMWLNKAQTQYALNLIKEQFKKK